MRRTRTTRTSVVVLAVLVLGTAACDQAQLDQARDTAEQAIDEAASRAEDLASDLPTAPALPTADEEPTDDVAAPEPEPEPTEETEAAVEATPSPAPAEEEDADGVPWWLVAAGLVLLLALLGLALAVRRARQRAARRGRLVDAALRDVGWLLGVADEHRAEVGAEARARDVRLRTDRVGDTLRELRPLLRERGEEAATELVIATTRLADVVVAELEDAVAGRRGADLDRDALADEVRRAAGHLREAARTRPT